MSHLSYPDENLLPDYEFSRMLGQTDSPDFDFQQLINAIDCQKDLYGAGIIYNDGMHSYLVRPSKYFAKSGQQRVTHIVITKLVRSSQTEISKSIKETVQKPSIKEELISTGLSCGALLLTGLASVICTGAAPITGGASAPLAVMAYAGTAATGLQCSIGLLRLYDIEKNDGHRVAWVDQQNWYKATMAALDMVSLASLAGPLKEAVATYKVMKSASSMRVIEWLKRYPRMERVRLTQAIIKHMNPGISNKAMKAMIQAGRYPKRFPTDAFHKLLKKQVITAVTSSMAVYGSIDSGIIHSSGEYALG
ncbi:hypothetical protein BH012_22460, partial [Salmonella enterica]|nr:hypothetical protein [Salmonella enterica]